MIFFFFQGVKLANTILGDVINDGLNSSQIEVSMAFKELYVHCTVAREKKKAMFKIVQYLRVLPIFG